LDVAVVLTKKGSDPLAIFPASLPAIAHSPTSEASLCVRIRALEGEARADVDELRRDGGADMPPGSRIGEAECEFS